MIDKFFLDTPNLVYEYIQKLQQESLHRYLPSLDGLTENGKNIELGFSCYALKIYFMTSNWDKLNSYEKKEWVKYLNSFQLESSNFPNGSFVDDFLIDSLQANNMKVQVKEIFKSTLNLISKNKYDTRSMKIKKSVNAETKQTVSTLLEISENTKYSVPFPYRDETKLFNYLNNLNWNTPWTSGAQFSSLCVYSQINDGKFNDYLYKFSSTINNEITGSYHNKSLQNSREIINGAMKIISGLDWLELPIHRPKKLIDYCLNNIPVSEGCDIVDFVYVLYKCSKQDDYRKKEISELMIQILDQLKKLYIEQDKSFSYFANKSQTHYYGSKITHGLPKADIHGSLLCLWAIIMILEILELKNDKLKIIKP